MLSDQTSQVVFAEIMHILLTLRMLSVGAVVLTSY